VSEPNPSADPRLLAIKRLTQALYDLHCAAGYLKTIEVPGGPHMSVPTYYECNRAIVRVEDLLRNVEDKRGA
jgi:hypothetical protein